MRVGVIGVQGDVSEHVAALRAAMAKGGFGGDVVAVRRREDLEACHALTIPGGESTTIGKLLERTGLHEDIVRRAEGGMPVLGTCAGCILLAKEGDRQVEQTRTKLLGLMGIAVDRNTFGRQRESFETDLAVGGLHGAFHGGFFPAPALTPAWGDCQGAAKVGGAVVFGPR